VAHLGALCASRHRTAPVEPRLPGAVACAPPAGAGLLRPAQVNGWEGQRPAEAAIRRVGSWGAGAQSRAPLPATPPATGVAFRAGDPFPEGPAPRALATGARVPPLAARDGGLGEHEAHVRLPRGGVAKARRTSSPPKRGRAAPQAWGGGGFKPDTFA